jgi:phosphoenolpyruvate synthase/pyruvate phosphate dikinase
MLDDTDNPEIVGQLGAQLAKLAKIGVSIVDGFVIPINQRLEYGMSNEVLTAFDQLDSEYVILRSSVNLQDYDTETIRDVQRDGLLGAISYIQQNNARRGRLVAVIVQRDLDAEVSGTIHSINPVTGDRSEVLIEANLWMNETILNGESEPDLIILNKRTGALTNESEEQDEICLSPKQLLKLHWLIRKAEDRLGGDISVDWAFDNGHLYALNVRQIDEKTIERFL